MYRLPRSVILAIFVCCSITAPFNLFAASHSSSNQSNQVKESKVSDGSFGDILASNLAADVSTVEMKTIDQKGLCPQTRGTIQAPAPFAKMSNPIPPTTENIKTGKRLFHKDVKPFPCEICHGFKGDGFGVIFQRMKPYPRDFTCYQTMNDVPDGQLFWIIKNGSHGTRMKAFEKLEDLQVWQIIHYLRKFAD
ncbi:MAG: c-type cytochrome [Candidatus Nitronauta litoralis]|uniref:C-type cytochrome n=1 Tax=Candidatus Nitronauta litoralis TaxID=2705533 RepID=A0A7T0G0V9_9BACT|nr:MAG: c-type cytochrome [Candidatus Nitronauta litoralis]